MVRKRSTADGATAAAKARQTHEEAERARLEQMLADASLMRAGIADGSPTMPATRMQLISVLDVVLEIMEMALTPPPTATPRPAKTGPKVRRAPSRKRAAAEVAGGTAQG